MNIIFISAFLAIIAYLCGSISSAILACKLLSLPDPRQQGSLNPGTTNVLRIGGKFAAAMTLLGDFMKGFLPVLLAKLLGLGEFIQALTALGAIIGHIFPIFFQFRGGKGVATLFGVVFALSWLLGMLCAITWLSVAIITRYSSLAALIMLILLPCFVFFMLDDLALIPIGIISLLVIWRHRTNIKRLFKGEENRIKFR